ncbi:MAG: hypothetical protein IJ143_10190, partial [Neisseriaceae bacterium]|nr:hypothetical protein [Neisseriaceae bacterium]
GFQPTIFVLGKLKLLFSTPIGVVGGLETHPTAVLLGAFSVVRRLPRFFLTKKSRNDGIFFIVGSQQKQARQRAEDSINNTARRSNAAWFCCESTITSLSLVELCFRQPETFFRETIPQKNAPIFKGAFVYQSTIIT